MYRNLCNIYPHNTECTTYIWGLPSSPMVDFPSAYFQCWLWCLEVWLSPQWSLGIWNVFAPEFKTNLIEQSNSWESKNKLSNESVAQTPKTPFSFSIRHPRLWDAPKYLLDANRFRTASGRLGQVRISKTFSCHRERPWESLERFHVGCSSSFKPRSHEQYLKIVFGSGLCCEHEEFHEHNIPNTAGLLDSRLAASNWTTVRLLKTSWLALALLMLWPFLSVFAVESLGLEKQV